MCVALGTGARILHILGKYSTEFQLQPHKDNFLLVLESKNSQDSLLVNKEHTLISAGFGFKTTSNFYCHSRSQGILPTKPDVTCLLSLRTTGNQILMWVIMWQQVRIWKASKLLSSPVCYISLQKNKELKSMKGKSCFKSVLDFFLVFSATFIYLAWLCGKVGGAHVSG